MATAEQAGGKHRFARKLFRLAVVKPAELGLAQTVWAAREIDQLIRVPDAQAVKESAEACARDALAQLRWQEAQTARKAWHHEEPFATTPVIIVNGAGIMYRRGGVKMYHGLRRELVRVVHGRAPRAGRRALRAAGGGLRVGEWNGRLPPLMSAVGRVEVDPHGPTASKCQGGRFGVFPGKPEGPR